MAAEPASLTFVGGGAAAAGAAAAAAAGAASSFAPFSFLSPLPAFAPFLSPAAAFLAAGVEREGARERVRELRAAFPN